MVGVAHTCPCGCGRGVSAGRLSCPTSWAWLNSAAPELARAVNRTWTARRRANQTPEAQEESTRAHMGAVRQAIQWFRQQRTEAVS